MAVIRELRCSELGVADCDYVARGETTGDVLEDMSEHLKTEHDIELPETEEIVKGLVDEDDLDSEARIIVDRLQERLAIAEGEDRDVVDSDVDVGIPVPPPQQE
jgi:predicted small metal-binding protein